MFTTKVTTITRTFVSVGSSWALGFGIWDLGFRSMNSRRRIAGVVAAGVLSAAVLTGRAVQSGEWPAYGGEHSTRYSPLDQINKTSIKKLTIAWRQSALPMEMRGGRTNVAVTNNW